jgi:hypothetical protein
MVLQDLKPVGRNRLVMRLFVILPRKFLQRPRCRGNEKHGKTKQPGSSPERSLATLSDPSEPSSLEMQNHRGAHYDIANEHAYST